MDMKSKKICHQKHFHQEVIDDLLLGGGGIVPPIPILGRVKHLLNKADTNIQNYHTCEINSVG